MAIANEDVIASLRQDIATEAAQLGDKTAECERKKGSGRQLQIDVDTLKQFNLSRRDVIVSIAYLGLRNDYRCDHMERARLAYTLGVLEAASSAYQIPDASIKGIHIQKELVYPDTRYLEMAVEYKKLPEGARQYLEEVAGTKPFDSIAVINALPSF